MVEGLRPIIRQSFDVVSFDPHGVGESRPLTCRGDWDAIFASDPGTPQGAAVVDEPLCAGWRAAPRPVEPAAGRDAPPILVVGATCDPSTSYRWGQRLAQSLRSATLLTYDGMGHTVFGRLMGNGSDCTDQWIDGYLISQGAAVGTVCPADVPPAAG